MADSITVSAQDVRNADTFLTAYLSDKIPDADFSEGSVTRDFVVKAIAYIFAFLRKEIKSAGDRQSLLTLSELEADEGVDDAVDALLSNWFLTRKGGRKARVVATLHFNRAADITLSPATRFFRTATRIFQPDTTVPVVIPAGDLKPTVNADGTIVDYTVNVTLVATSTGSGHNVTPGRFTAADPFSPFFLYAENLSEGSDGLDIESTKDLLARAPSSISVRNLVNARSIDTVLRERFAGVNKVLTVGFGDAEMLRDFVEESVTKLKMHTGGYTDIYVSMSRTEVTETLTVGAVFLRPDNLINVLKDASVDFVAKGVLPGDVLRVYSGLPNTPPAREFIITTVAQHQVQIQHRHPFPVATEEKSGTVGYTIGRLSPAFDNVVRDTITDGPQMTGATARTIQQDGRVVLAGRPHYAIKKVEVLHSDGTTTLLSERVNGAVDTLSYRVHGLVPALAQSGFDTMQVEVHTSHNNKSLRVTYETLVGYEDVQQYVTDRFERVINSSPLVKAYHPVYLSVNMAVCRKSNALAVLDLAAIRKSIVAYINTFDLSNAIDVSGIEEHVRKNFPDIGIIYNPVNVAYTLLSPDGQVYQFDTRDIVTLEPTFPGNRARLTNGLSLASPIPYADLNPTLSANNASLFAAANVTLKDHLRTVGITDRNVRYMCQLSDVSVDEVA